MLCDCTHTCAVFAACAVRSSSGTGRTIQMAHRLAFYPLGAVGGVPDMDGGLDFGLMHPNPVLITAAYAGGR